jgi:hypothetical protein
MPIGAGAATRSEGDVEHKTASYLLDDDDVWDVDTPTVSPVLGQDPPGYGGR